MRLDTKFHDEGKTPDLHTVEPVYQFAPGTYLENLAVRHDGTILVTILEGTLMLIDPKGGGDGGVGGGGSTKAKASLVHTFEKDITGIVEVEPDTFYVSEGRIGVKHWKIWKVNMNEYSEHSSGYVRLAADVFHAEYLNGSALLDRENRHILVADSYLGEIINVDLGLGTSKVWLKDDKVLGKLPDKEFEEKKEGIQVAGVNGLKVHGGFVYFTSTERKLVGRIKIQTSSPGKKAGSIENIATKLVADDFVVADERTLYLATHVYQSVVKLVPHGKRTRIAGGQEDPICAGTTAVALGLGEEKCLYVTTNGGITNPVGERPGPAMLLKIKL